ncbi:MAG: DNA mismatch endonuclease Vsr [Chloroflexota bacterium]|nr:DNA mismatch endonuclease Vsr [Chloroflexota bacterium]
MSEDHRRLVELVPRGGTWRDIPPYLLSDRFRGMRRTDSTNLYGRLDPALPSYTINTQFDNPSTGCYTHPYEDRALTVREGARLQTFPDTYQFVGKLTSRCRQIGNAVPPLLAATLANALADQLLDGVCPACRVTLEPMAPAYKPPTDQTRARMQRQRRADTGPEVAVRQALHARGLRFRKGYAALADRRSIDVAFPSQRVAVFLDGCFWHGCPQHERPTKSNTLWWAEKIAANKRRDAKTVQDLQAQGWAVLRFWEHEQPENVADMVARVIAEHRQKAA